MSDAEIDELVSAGRKGWEHGAPMPPYPTTDLFTPQALYWLGYVTARGQDFLRRRDMALYPDTVEPRP